MREFLKGLELDQETIDTIMAEYGKNVTKDKEELQKYKGELQTLTGRIKDLEESSKNATELQEKYEALSKSIEEEEARKQVEEKQKAITKNIESAIGDKQFINEYTRNAIINEVRNALNDENNIGKSTADIFEEITKDKEDIFVNPNQVKDVPGVSNDVYSSIDKEAFDKMGYKERIALKQDNPELFKQLNG